MPRRGRMCIFLKVGLGEAAKRGVGTGASQIPDMSFWQKSAGTSRWRKFPDGTIIQTGISVAGNLGTPSNITLPVSFSNTAYSVVTSYDNARSGVTAVYSFSALPVTPSQFSLMGSLASQISEQFAYWIAIGD
ncbi:phage tail protein [Enterobacter sp. Cy-643]|uniref:gp53-like domain-containing protein n=1 Tax=Enterobacter sp. Cy-643 TaxID=2608346 RepID=UPI00257035D5|nr:phage tail protein [Enterobacter sp. Cy-643]